MQKLVFEVTAPGCLADMMLRYLEWMAVTHYSPLSCTGRRCDLHLFYRWCLERAVEHPQAITLLLLQQYQRHLFYYRKPNGQALTNRRQASRLTSLRNFFKWLAKNQLLPYNPASELELPRKDQLLPKTILTESEAEIILNQPNLEQPQGIRDRAMLETLYSTGIRRAELCRLQLVDLDRERGTLFIHQGKGQKDRVVPIGERAMAWIEHYQHEVRPQLSLHLHNSTLFLTYQGQAFSPDGFSHLVRHYVNQAAIGKTGGCHLFRHTMATLMLENGADIRIIQKILGHAKLETTQIYTQVSIRLIKEIHTLTHPGAKLKNLDKANPNDSTATD